jgi:hypothetical protein
MYTTALHWISSLALAQQGVVGGSICRTDPASPDCLGELTVTSDSIVTGMPASMYTVGAHPYGSRYFTIQLPDDGVLNFTTVHIDDSVGLFFARNARNTPVYLLASGDITVEGVIGVSGGNGGTNYAGAGGPGGFDGGGAGYAEIQPGTGHGPGGGVPDAGASHATDGYYNGSGSRYGSKLLLPLVGGSGGGGGSGSPGNGGGGGGGAILLASDTRVHIFQGTFSYNYPAGTYNGRVTARGAYGHRGGSGGAVRIVAPRVTGNGYVECDGASYGGQGYLRIDTAEPGGVALVPSGCNWTLGSYLVARPAVVPSLVITELAGVPVSPDTPAVVTLPFGSTTERTVKVRPDNFTTTRQFVVAVIPRNGARVLHGPFTIDPANADPSAPRNDFEWEVDISLLVNTVTHVEVWTR